MSGMICCRQPICRIGWRIPVCHRASRFTRLSNGVFCSAQVPLHAHGGTFAGHSTSPLLLCLERAIGDRSGQDAALWHTGAFEAQVYPDLPFATSWNELLRKSLRPVGRRPATSPALETSTDSIAGTSLDNNNNKITVRTVAAQCRSERELQERLQAACGPRGVEGGKGKHALLLVSGSHPARALPGASYWMQSSFTLLKKAWDMRSQGIIPPETLLWAVENPAHSPNRMFRKVESGAEVLLTQPPFVRDKAQLWFGTAEKQGIARHTRIVAGVPMASSLGNLRFWLALCGLAGTAEARAVEAAFPKPSGNKQEDILAVIAWNAEFIRWVSWTYVSLLLFSGSPSICNLLALDIYYCYGHCFIWFCRCCRCHASRGYTSCRLHKEGGT
jgi:hypothetical protein